MVLPSGLTMEAMAFTSRSAGASTTDLSEPWISAFCGPPHSPPRASSSK
jgi:hypothetical protein